ncbi:hypothetical protein [Acinetobacter sp. SA01]|uniref:hypothetical protein n=1 Tax=Acinetobacter sp. SA01 TaxID=1862567 RepID=UPI001408E617|nr:hypothetical protein [Acinetobacter sp. SA01]
MYKIYFISHKNSEAAHAYSSTNNFKDVVVDYLISSMQKKISLFLDGSIEAHVIPQSFQEFSEYWGNIYKVKHDEIVQTIQLNENLYDTIHNFLCENPIKK